MLRITMDENKSNFNIAYSSLNGVIVSEGLLDTLWQGVMIKQLKRAVNDFFPNKRDYLMGKPYALVSDKNSDIEFNIAVEDIGNIDHDPISEEVSALIIHFMRRIISHRFKVCFKERFGSTIKEDEKHMWNVQTRRRWKKYNRLVFERAVAAYLREAGREAEWHFECVNNGKDHTFKHRTSKRIAEFYNFFDMLEYGVFNIITNTDTTAVYFITSGYINGYHLSYKRFRALPYEHIAEVYRELTEMEKYPDGVFAIQTTMVFYNKKGMVYDVNYPPEKKDGEEND